MKYKWINKQNNSHLILFFNGWGCDENQFKHLESDSHDILMFNDYKTLHLNEGLRVEMIKYNKISIIAWSFGVWVAQFISEKYELKVYQAIAINGTLTPIHNQFGIDKSIVQGTYDYLSERNLMKFQRRMVGGNEAWKKFEVNKPQRAFENQKEELGTLIQLFNQKIECSSIYNKAIIGTNDLIFTTENQKSYWQDKIECQEINEPHFCFYKWNTWSIILK